MLSRIAALLRAAAILGLLLALSGIAGLPSARAQDGEPAEPPTETPVPAPIPEGTLVILTAICTVEAAPPASVTILTDAELAEQSSCVAGSPALVFVDDFEAFDAESGRQVALPVGSHTLTDVNSGASRGVEIVEGTVSTLVVTTFDVLPPTEVPTEVPTAEPTATQEPTIEAAAESGSVTLVTHLCRQGIATTAELDAVDSWGKQLVACPVVVLEADVAGVTEDAVTANDPENPLTYAQTVTYDDGGEVVKALVDGEFAQASLCEDGLGESLNGVDSDDRCYDQSGYAFPNIPAGPVTVASTDAPGDDPDEYIFLTAKNDPGTDDDGSIESVDETVATVTLNTGGDPAVTIHLFFAPEPIVSRVTVIGHLCPASIESQGDFNAIGTIEDKLVACPSLTLPGDAGPSEGETAGQAEFPVTVQGATGTPRAIASSMFAPTTICERDLPESLDGDLSNDRCLDASGYVVDDVAQGSIRVDATDPPPGDRFIAGELGPDPDDDDATITPPPSKKGLVKLDTTSDGNVVVHVFFAPVAVATATPTKTATKTPTKTPRPTKTPTRTATPAPGDPTATPTRTPTRTPVPTSTPTPTSTPDGAETETATPTESPSPTKTPTGGGGGGTGSIKVLKFYCIGDGSLSRINVLEPGASASRDDLGDATCQNANIQFAELILADGSKRDAAVPSIGILEITGIPATEGDRLHTFDDISWGLKGKFKVEGGKQTILVSLTYEVTDGGDFPDPPDIREPDIDENPPPLPPSAGDPGFPDFPDEGDNDPEPVEDPAANPFDNIDGEEVSPEEVEEEKRAEAEVAKVDEGEDFPTVGTARANQSVTPLWLILAGFGMVGASLVSRRRRRTRVA